MRDNVKEKVCVLMTTYNPKEYVIEQVESILRQENVDTSIIIRDDASNEKAILNKLKDYKDTTVLEGEKNIGVRDNILELLSYVQLNCADYDYYAYSDQDDVWYSDKLYTAIISLRKMNNDIPNLYYSNLLVVDENLKPSHELQKRGVVKNSIGQSLSQIFLFACTAVFNKKMIDVILSTWPGNMGFDYLLYYIGILKGEVYYDDIPHIYYRQHGDNVSGVKYKGWKYFWSKRNIIRTDERFFKNVANYLLRNMSQGLDEKDLNLIKKVADYDGIVSRIRILLDHEIKAGYYPKNFYNAIRIIVNRY